MKLKLMLFTLLIGMISFAGIRPTTTDLKPNSNYDVVAVNADFDHSVVILSVNENLNVFEQVSVKNNNDVVETYCMDVKVSENEAFGRSKIIPDLDYRQCTSKDKLTMLPKKRKFYSYRLARDGHNYNA